MNRLDSNKYGTGTYKNLMNGNNPDYPVYSISEINKRTNHLALAAIGIGILNCIYYSFLGLTVTAVTVIFFYCGLGLILFLNYKKVIKNTKLPIVTFVSLSLILFAALEGAGTAQYLYYFPLIIAVPVIVDNQKIFFKKISLYFGIAAVCFLICILVGNFHQPWEPLSENNRLQVFYTNAISAIILTIGFAYTNISLERKYLKELIDQKNRTINTRTQFLSTMGHELRTPLNGIIGAINILKRGASLPEQQEYFDILKYCSDHMLHQVNDILDFNKIEAGKLEIHPIEVNLKQLLVNSTIPFANQFEEKNLELRVNIDPELDIVVMADDVRMIQILNNLLSNAFKFTSKGYIKLTVKALSKNDSSVRVGFWVEDTGNGIEEKDQKRIFDSFGQIYDESTRKYSGSGLGLNICLEILKLMNSHLNLKSEKGIGSIFSFEINFDYLSKQLQDEQNDFKDKQSLSGVKVLLAEDNRINMIIAVKILMDFQAECTKAFNGQEALTILENNHDYNIILMDLEMPIMDGYTAIKAIKNRWPNIPVLAFTATLMDLEMLEKLKSIGFADCILKPFQPSNLLAQIKKYTVKPFHNLN